MIEWTEVTHFPALNTVITQSCANVLLLRRPGTCVQSGISPVRRNVRWVMSVSMAVRLM